MKRAASFGRAPMMPDVEIAASLLGYQGDVDADVRARGAPTRVHGADHEYGVRRAVVDAVPDAVLRLPPQVPALLAEFRGELQQSLDPLTHPHGQGPVLARTDGLAPHRRRAHRAVQLALRPPSRRHASSCASRTPTSPARREEWVVGIQDTLRWLGLDWDEGPYPPERRASTSYLAAADRLLAAGDAYECYCTEDEVKERNDAAVAAGRPPGYDGHCRDLTADERAALAAEGRPRIVRFRTPDDGRQHASPTSIRGEVQRRVVARSPTS